jgi:hypothetical protein
MKKLVLLAVLALSVSCSNDDDNCDQKASEINAYYDQQVQYVMDNPDPWGVNYNQISLLNQERNKKLQNACN